MRPSRPARAGAVDVFGLGSQMPGFGASQLELALEIGEGDIDVAHSHGRIDVTEQLHQDGEADAAAKHLCGVGMPAIPNAA